MPLQFVLGSGTADFEEELTRQSSEWMNKDKKKQSFLFGAKSYKI